MARRKERRRRKATLALGREKSPMEGRAEKYLERRLKRQSLDCKNEKGKNHVGGDFVYIVPPNGRDEGTANGDSPDFAAWHHQGRSTVRRFDAPPSDCATSPHPLHRTRTNGHTPRSATGRDVWCSRRGGGNDGSTSRWDMTPDTGFIADTSGTSDTAGRPAPTDT